VNNLKISTPYAATAIAPVKQGSLNEADVRKAAGHVEEVFLNELLKTMFQNTDLAKDKIISGYLPYITAEVSKSLVQRGIGIQEFLTRSQSFNNLVTDPKGKKGALSDAVQESSRSTTAESTIKAYGGIQN
jgi:Rod binding domain-containing protein